MKKLNSVIYHKLLVQAEEAKDRGMTTLASSIMEAIGPYPNEESSEYTYAQLEEEIQKDMWKMATRLMHYYDIESLDAGELDKTIVSLASQVVDALESTMRVDDVVVGPLEPKVPGENK